MHDRENYIRLRLYFAAAEAARRIAEGNREEAHAILERVLREIETLASAGASTPVPLDISRI